MKNRITIIIILISMILLIYTGINGIKIGKLQILSIEQLKERNIALNEKIDEASKLTSIDYPDNVQTLEQTFDKYKIQKQKYEELAGVTTEVREEIYETKQYDISFLWRKIGSYAQKRKLNIRIDVQKNSTGQSSYNITFNISGQYVNISQFITDIENDSDLYFRIYNFNMSGSEESVASTFTVRNVNIDPSTITETQPAVMENNE